MKKAVSLILVTLLLLGMLAGCGNSGISVEKAQKIVLKDLGVSADQVTMHTHIGNYENTPCISIYVTVNGETLEYSISADTGKILTVAHSDHSH